MFLTTLSLGQVPHHYRTQLVKFGMGKKIAAVFIPDSDPTPCTGAPTLATCRSAGAAGTPRAARCPRITATRIGPRITGPGFSSFLLRPDRVTVRGHGGERHAPVAVHWFHSVQLVAGWIGRLPTSDYITTAASSAPTAFFPVAISILTSRTPARTIL